MFSTVGLQREEKSKTKPCIYLAHPAGTKKRDLPSKAAACLQFPSNGELAVLRLEITALGNVENGEEQGENYI